MDAGGYNILLVYRSAQFPLRQSALDHLECFRRHGGARVFYCNLAAGPIPRWLLDVPFDLVILHSVGLDRGNRETFCELIRQVEPLAAVTATKIMLPQDEFTSTDLLVRLIRQIGIHRVYSVAAASEWPKIYDGVPKSVRFERVLTGYVEPSTWERIQRLEAAGCTGTGGRPLDVGYRGYDVPMWFGGFGVLKGRLPLEVRRSASARGLRCDLSTRYEDTLYGFEWYRFLLGCRWTIGIEGGASLLDTDGSLRAAAERYLAAHPGADFAEVAAHCFAGQDGNLDFKALSPRQLEAAMTGTGQLLVEGDYNGILQADAHYLPLRRDLADLDERVAELADEERRLRMVRAVREDVVRNPACGYPAFVRGLLSACLPARPAGGDSARDERLCRAAWRRELRWRRRFAWLQVASRRVPRMLRGTWLTATLRRWLYPTKHR